MNKSSRTGFSLSVFDLLDIEKTDRLKPVLPAPRTFCSGIWRRNGGGY
jgi:hypothetical protein